MLPESGPPRAIKKSTLTVILPEQKGRDPDVRVISKRAVPHNSLVSRLPAARYNPLGAINICNSRVPVCQRTVCRKGVAGVAWEGGGGQR